jgi:hypothetical protein
MMFFIVAPPGPEDASQKYSHPSARNVMGITHRQQATVPAGLPASARLRDCVVTDTQSRMLTLINPIERAGPSVSF